MTTKRVALILALVAAGLGAGAQSFAKPSAEITKFQIEAISLRDVTFLFELSVKNPYPLGLKFSGLTLDFSVEGAKVFSTASAGGFAVPAMGTKANRFTVTLPYDSIIKLVKNYASKDWLNTVVNGKLSIPLPRIPGLPADISFSYKLEKKIPAIKPTLAIKGFKVTPPSAKEIAQAAAKAGKNVDSNKAMAAFADILAGKTPSSPVIDPSELDVPIRVSFTIEIGNDAKGPLDFNALGYELIINGERLVVGQSSDVRREGQKIFVTVVNTFSSKLLSKNIRSLLKAKKGSFQVLGSASIKLPDSIRKDPVALDFDEGGTFSF